LTHRWREIDSNPRSLVDDSIFSRPRRNPRLRNRPGCQNRILRIDKGRFYRAPSRAGPGNDINAGSAGFQEARHRGVLDKSESG
jgi:hypothetical protein